MLTEKANAICLLEVLKEYSDAEHILPMREIIAKMQSLYGIKIDRRTVYGAVALLIELGYDISLYEDNGVGYYLRRSGIGAVGSPAADRCGIFFPVHSRQGRPSSLSKNCKSSSVSTSGNSYRHLTVAAAGPQDRQPAGFLEY